jgi:CTP:molybdopterin cytidylyltransferase MocA
MALRPDHPLRDLWRRDDVCVIRIPVDDPHVHADLDTPEDVRRCLKAEARPWRRDTEKS